MGVDTLGFLYGWKFTLTEFFKLLISEGCIRKQDVVKFGIAYGNELKRLDISEQEWQQGVDELIAAGKAVWQEEIGSWKIEDGKCKYYIYPLKDEAEDFIAHDIIYSLSEYLGLELKEEWGNCRKSIGWLHTVPAHDDCNNNLDDSYVLVGKINTTCDLYALEKGFATPCVLSTECPDVLGFLDNAARFQRNVYILTDDCWCCT